MVPIEFKKDKRMKYKNPILKRFIPKMKFAIGRSNTRVTLGEDDFTSKLEVNLPNGSAPHEANWVTVIDDVTTMNPQEIKQALDEFEKYVQRKMVKFS